MAFIDYYKILGVDRNIPQNEVRAAYRKRAKQFHPDLHPNDPKAKAKFQALSEAFEVIPMLTRTLEASVEHKATQVATIHLVDSTLAALAVEAVASVVSSKTSSEVAAAVVRQDLTRAGRATNSLWDRWKPMLALTFTQLC